jgi:hypothetical protein
LVFTLCAFSLFWGIFLSLPLDLEAQGGGIALTGPEKKQLLAIAREPLSAALEGRPVLTPNVGQRLMVRKPVVVSLFLDGKLIARSWEIKEYGPLATQIMGLSSLFLSSPQFGRIPEPEELSRGKIHLAILGRFNQVPDDKAVGEGEGVVILNGFKEGVATPMDIPPGGSIQDMLRIASEIAGLRPNAWLLPETSILTSPADEALEE